MLVSGASGLIGQALVPCLQQQGWQVDKLVRRKSTDSTEIAWDPRSGTVTWPQNYHCDAVVHLAGANIAAGRWTAQRKQLIKTSRVQGTRTLVTALGELGSPPTVLVSGSATGFYGSRGDETCAESTSRGTGFLAEVCDEWESAAKTAAEMGVRVVLMRTGVVLSPSGGALAKMTPLFKMGLGGSLGSGKQWLSWISLPDWMRVCLHALEHATVVGPLNVVSPHPVRQSHFAQTLGGLLHRPAIIPAPAFALRLGLGQMADETLLASTRVIPEKLSAMQWEFLHPTLENALGHVLGKSSSA